MSGEILWLDSVTGERGIRMDKIIFTGDDGEAIEFFVLEETQLSGNKYLLVCDSEDEDEESEATILKEITDDGDDSVYEFVEDDVEFEAVAKLFDELIGEDADIDFN
jgi:hypothetical protein